jgi:carbon-monoxide dehydrogenase medium subunit
MYGFRYRRAMSVTEAAAMLTADENALLLAGGQTLVPTLKLRMGQPSQLIDIGRIAELKGIRMDGASLTIGATTPHAAVAESAHILRAIPALARLAAGIGDPLVRNLGTIGGSLAYNHPGADYPGAMLGLGATVVTSRREIGSDEFLQGMLDTALEPGEIIVAVRFPIPRRAGYVKFPSPASGYVLTGAFVAETASGIRVAINGAGPCAFRHTGFEEALATGFDAAALDGIGVPADDLLDDLHAGPEYRAQLATVAVHRAVAQARGPCQPSG